MGSYNSTAPWEGACPGGLGGFWNYDDFEQCHRQRYFEYYVAVAALVVAIAYSAFHIFLPSGSDEHIEENVFHPADAPDKNASIIVRQRSISDRLRIVAEFGLNVFQTGVLAFAWRSKGVQEHYSKYAGNALGALLLLSMYTLACSVYRLVKAKARSPLVASPFMQQAYIYTLFLTMFGLEWFSALTHSHSTVTKRVFSTLLTVSAANWLILFTSPLGDNAARLYTAEGSTPSPEMVSSLLTYMTCRWNAEMIEHAQKNPINEETVWDLCENDHVYRFMASINVLPSKWSFFHKLIIALRKPITLNILFGCVGSVLKLTPTLLVQQILRYVETRSVPQSVAWLYVFGLGLVYFLENVIMNQAFYQGRKLSLGVRSLIIGSVYRKALFSKIPSAKAGKSGEAGDDSESVNSDGSDEESEDIGEFDASNTGAVINLMSVDSFKVADFASYLHDDFATPLLVIASIWFLYNIIGWSSFVAVAVMLAIMPFNMVLAKRMSDVQDRLMAVTDRRIEKTNELLGAIRIVKFYAWERQFTDKIFEIRDEELRLLLWRYVYWTGSSFCMFLMPILVIVASFWCYVRYQGGNLTSSVAFTAISVFYILRMPLDDLTNVITRLSSLLVSVRRIETYLAEEETPKYDQLESPLDAEHQPSSQEFIGFKNAVFSWGSGISQSDGSQDAFKLRDINLKFVLGDLNVIVGATGSGKTSLLLALLGEMRLEKGHVYLPHGNRRVLPVDSDTGLTESVAYCPQEAWLVNDTIKNNILFAQAFDKNRYNRVLDACQLRHDLSILSEGDQTFIGDKGIALSGGQKQRVSIARAMYSNSRYIILDDCLSAVDSHTAESLYNEALTGLLAQGRTIILVSHNVALTIGKAALVAVMSNGRIVTQGSPLEVSASGHLGDDDLVRKNAESSAASRSNSVSDLQKLNTVTVEVERPAAAIGPGPGPGSGHAMVTQVEEDVTADASRDKEERADGSVPLTTYKYYISLLGNRLGLFLCASLIVIVPFLEYSESWWIKVWAGHMGDVEKGAVKQFVSNVILPFGSGRSKYVPIAYGKGSTDENTLASLKYYSAGYIIIGLITTAAALAREFLIALGGLRAAKKLFKQLLHSVVGARMQFFDSTPSGRIINRFSKDMETIDQDISGNILWFTISVVDACQVTFIIGFVTPIFFPFACVIAWIFSLIGSAYLAAARELKRLESVTRSPIFQQFGETLGGSVVIRAYGDEQRFQSTNWMAVDTTHRPYFWLWVSNRWLTFCCSTLSLWVCVCAATFVVYGADIIDPGFAGISLSFSTYFGECILWIVRNYAECEVSMNSVERVYEYLNIEQEAPGIVPESRPPQAWPHTGDIKFKGLSLRYSESLPRVIDNVSCHIPGGNKVGIVGRTGAGKSTIITALFRLLEPDAGSITIDDVDISTIGLEDLRKGLSIIPQDPTLFKGTLRSNLDLFKEYTEERIFRALSCVNLVPSGTTVESARLEIENGADGENVNQFLDLESEVSEGGRNLSQGQRQLLCLARAILKEPRILLLDEATASIDYDTDATIQKTIRDNFDAVTILTIAHRLRTIADYDLILVLDKGHTAQFGHPYDLLQDKEGLFYSMCEKSGELEALIKLAEESKNRSSK